MYVRGNGVYVRRERGVCEGETGVSCEGRTGVYVRGERGVCEGMGCM